MSAPVSSEPFRALMVSLAESGYATHSGRLASIPNGTWTTSSEMIAELGATVLEIRRECRPSSPAQRALVRQCLKEVRKAWPGFGWSSWIPFRR